MTLQPETFVKPSAQTLTMEQAEAERRQRTRQHANHCVLLAVVTSREVAADLIDRAVEYSRAD